MKKYFSALAITIIVLLTGCNKDDENKDPVAAFSWELTQTPGEVKFTNKSTDAVTYEWSFGDGKFNTQKDPVHLYDQNDTYIVKLTAFGNTANNSVSDTITVDNIP